MKNKRGNFFVGKFQGKVQVWLLIICILLTVFAAFTLTKVEGVAYASEYEDAPVGNYVGINEYGEGLITYLENMPNKKYSEEPMITVLTHGQGGSASHWSNNYVTGDKNYDIKFAYDKDSLMERIRTVNNGNMDLFVAKYDKDGKFF